MQNVIIWGKKFVPYIHNDTIQKSIAQSAALINKHYGDATEETAPIFISVLNGAFMYTSDLMKELTIPCELSFIKVDSYSSLHSTGEVREMIGLSCSVEERDIVIVDDIVDTGTTMKFLIETFSKMKPRSIKVATLLYKPGTCCNDLTVDFPCITMNDSNFTIGYGLDYNGLGRNLKDIYILDK